MIQARMSSVRLPEKIMLKACGKTLLEHLIDRVKQAKKLEKIMVATTTNIKDNVVEQVCIDNNVECFRGPEDDVLSRYKLASDKAGASIIVKLHADSPLIDPIIIDKVIEIFLNGDFDYVSNWFPKQGTYPRGTSVEVFSSKTLEQVYNEAERPSEREHASSFIWKQPHRYKLYRLDMTKNLSNYRLNVDYKEDYTLVKSVFEGLFPQNPYFTLNDIISWLDSHPEVLKFNSHIKTDEGWSKSLEKDRKLGFE